MPTNPANEPGGSPAEAELRAGGSPLHAAGRMLRRSLDALYLAGGLLGAMFLALILIVIVLEMTARWASISFPGSTDYAGYCMAASAFLPLAYTLNQGAHIRVGLVLSRLGRYRRIGEIWCFGIGALLASYFAYYAIRAVNWSYKLNDISQGQDATPLWIPQIAMAAGVTLFAVALADHAIRLILFGTHGIADHSLEDRHVE